MSSLTSTRHSRMCESWPGSKFVQRLPNPPGGWTPLVRVTILATGIYRSFVQQCRSNTLATTVRGDRQRSALNQALGWHRPALFHYQLAMAFYLYNLIKYRLVALVHRDALLGQFQYLDCFLLGRFRYLGRTNKIGSQITSVFFLWFFIYRLLIHLRVPKFKFFMFEFLMASREEIELCESQADLSGALVLPNSSASRGKFNGTNYTMQNQLKPVDQVNSLFYLHNQFDPRVPNRWILRPNRTSESWLALTFAFKYLCYWSMVVFAGCLVMLYWAIGGSVLTNFGFEMSYPSCVIWLRDLQSPQAGAHTRNSYSHIYLAPKILAHEVRIDDVPARMPFKAQDFHQATDYSLTRITFDVIENHLIYFEYVLLFVALFNTLVIQSIDVIFNAAAIRVRLLSVLEKLEARMERQCDRCESRDKFYAILANEPMTHDDGELLVQRTSFKSQNHTRRRKPIRRKSAGKCPQATSLKWRSRDYALMAPQIGFSFGDKREQLDDLDPDEHLNEELCNLQAILVDHFDTITRGYNRFVSFIIGLLGLCWLHYTLVVCMWMGTIRSRAVEFEFVLAETNITCSCMTYLSGAALIRSRNLQLYPLIARAMALDPNWSQTKLRWATILKYFHPRPFYCFTVLENTEISWLLCIKLLSWILSAFILLANFFYMNRF